jgi:hypothetical protein
MRCKRSVAAASTSVRLVYTCFAPRERGQLRMDPCCMPGLHGWGGLWCHAMCRSPPIAREDHVYIAVVAPPEKAGDD